MAAPTRQALAKANSTTRRRRGKPRPGFWFRSWGSLSGLRGCRAWTLRGRRPGAPGGRASARRRRPALRRRCPPGASSGAAGPRAAWPWPCSRLRCRPHKGPAPGRAQRQDASDGSDAGLAGRQALHREGPQGHGGGVNVRVALAEVNALGVAGILDVLLRQHVAEGQTVAGTEGRRTVAKVGCAGYNDRGPPLSLRLLDGVWNKEGPTTGLIEGRKAR